MNKIPPILDRIVTEFRDNNKTMIQHFGDDSVQLVTDFRSGRTHMLRKGQVCVRERELSFEEYENMQTHAAIAYQNIQFFNSL